MTEHQSSVDRWKHAEGVPRLQPGDIHLWKFSLTAPMGEREALCALLDENERQRAGRMRLDHVKARFEVAHARLRQVLSRYVGSPPAALVFGKADGGKPHLGAAPAPEGIQFSLSHSGDLALLGVTLGRAIGVDVEVRRDAVDIDLIARRQFAPGEIERISRVHGDARTNAFYRCWTRKEAYLKARGEGLIGRLQDFEVACLPEEPAEIRWVRAGDAERVRWELLDVVVGDGAVGACVVERPIGSVGHFIP